MKKSLLEFYALAVCFVTLIVTAVTLGIGIYNLVQITNPRLTLNSHEWKNHQTNDKYFEQYGYLFHDRKDQINVRENISEDDLTKKRQDSLALALDSERRGAVQSLIRVLIILIINVLIFLPHWKLAKSSREIKDL